MQSAVELADVGSTAYAAGGQSWFSPGVWPLLSLFIWGVYVTLKGWHTLGIWERRHVAFGILSALLFINYLSVSPDFQGWADVYYFCGSKLQYCNCNFRWNLRGWLKAYVLWSFILSSASGLQKLVIQLGLNGLLPGEEVVTRESVVSICWRLIPYWLNNWEQQWGAECSSMMFELPHFAVELLVVLPCIQILCARLKILAMPLVYLGPAAQQQLLAAHHDDAADEQAGLVHHDRGAHAGNNQQQNAQAAGIGQDARGGEAGQHAANNARQARRAHRHRGVVRQEFAPNILKGYWERAPEQQKLLPRLRANMQVMLFTVFITVLAATNALIVPLWLESTVTSLPTTHVIRQAGLHPQWFTNDSKLNITQEDGDVKLDMPDWHVQLLTSRLDAYQQPRPSIFSRRTSQMVMAEPSEEQLRKDVAWARYMSHLKLAPLAAAIRQRSLSGIVDFVRWKALTETLSADWKPSAEEVAKVLQHSYPGLKKAKDDLPVAVGPFNPETMSYNQYYVPRQVEPKEQACSGKMKRFRSNLEKHAQEISKMQAPVHRALIPLVESALAVMRLACEKFFLLLAILVSNLLFRDNPPRPVRMFIRSVAKLSTIFQKVILYSFPAVCWLYGAGVLFSMFVSVVFWGSPLLSLYDTLRTSASTVRVKNLRHATDAELERMAGNCAICWGEMHVGANNPSNSNHDSSEQHDHEPSTSTDTILPAVATQAAQELAPRASNGVVEAPPSKQERLLASGSGSGNFSTSASSTTDSKLSSNVSGPEHSNSNVSGDIQQPCTDVIVRHTEADTANNNAQGTAELPAAVTTAVRHSSQGGHGVAQQGALNEEQRAWSLPCGHAYHYVCLSEWLKQCHSNSVPPTCPMCQARIQLEVRYRFPFPLKRQATRNGPPDMAVHADANEAAVDLERRLGLAVGLGPNAFGNADGPDSSEDEEEEVENRNIPAGGVGGVAAADDGEEELGVVMMPVMNPAGLGRQRQGRVRNVGPLRPHENLLLPPPMAALGNMHMLRLLDFHRELQEMLQDMPQIPPPEDVALLQLVAQQQQQQQHAIQLPFVAVAADRQAHAPLPVQQQEPEVVPVLHDNIQQPEQQPLQLQQPSQAERGMMKGVGVQPDATSVRNDSGEQVACSSGGSGTVLHNGQLLDRGAVAGPLPPAFTSTQAVPTSATGANATSSIQGSISGTGLRHRVQPSAVTAGASNSASVQITGSRALVPHIPSAATSGMQQVCGDEQHAASSAEDSLKQASLSAKDGYGPLPASKMCANGSDHQLQKMEASVPQTAPGAGLYSQRDSQWSVGNGTSSSPVPDICEGEQDERQHSKGLCRLQHASSAQPAHENGSVLEGCPITLSHAASSPVASVIDSEGLPGVASGSNGIATTTTALPPSQADEPQQRRRFLFFHRCKGNNA